MQGGSKQPSVNPRKMLIVYHTVLLYVEIIAFHLRYRLEKVRVHVMYFKQQLFLVNILSTISIIPSNYAQNQEFINIVTMVTILLCALTVTKII